MMAAAAAAPRPKSPPASPDPCGRHRLQLAVDALHREIGFLEGEISSIEGVHAASRCCKEVDEFVGSNPDPFITIQPEKGSHDQSQQFLKKSRAKNCLSYYLSWICCCGGGWCPPVQLKRPAAPSCSCAPRLRKLCCCRCRVVYAGAGCGCCAPCPRCSCDCTCACPRCCSCACPRCSAACCCAQWRSSDRNLGGAHRVHNFLMTSQSLNYHVSNKLLNA